MTNYPSFFSLMTLQSDDNYLFTKHNGDHVTIMLVYIDDIILTSNNIHDIDDIINMLNDYNSKLKI